MDIWFAIILFLIILNVLCIISVIFVERKKPQTTIAWVMVMSFLPIVGCIIYLLIGSTVIPTVTKKFRMIFEKYDYYTENFYKYLNVNKKEVLGTHDPILDKYKDIILMNINENGSLYSNDNKVELITSAKEKYRKLFEDIENAKETINIQYFIIRTDPLGKALVQLLAKKAREGVVVNLLYDELGSLQTCKKFFNDIVKAGGNVERFFTTVFANIIRFNHRNHRKIVVIDGKIGYTGGINIGLEYMGLKKIKSWRDTHLRIEGSAVSMLQIRFLLDWIFSKRGSQVEIDAASFEKYFYENKNDCGNVGVQIVYSGPDSIEEEIKYGYIKMINSAKKNIYVQTPYFVPDEPLMESLKLAALSGVDVRFIVPGVPDKFYVYKITESYIHELLKYGVKVYLYPGFIHSKSIVVDSFVASIGTTNFDVRSFALNFEVNAFMYNEEFAKLNEQVFEKDQKISKELKYEEFKNRKLYRKILESLFRLFAPLA